MDDIFAMHEINSQDELGHNGPDLLFGEPLLFLQMLQNGPVPSEYHHHAYSFSANVLIITDITSLKLHYIIADFELS